MIPGTRVAVIGLGLMGGSLARALAAQGAHLLGYDREPGHLEDARRAGVVHEALDGSLQGVAAADVVLLALPADATIHALAVLAPHLAGARLVMDVASIKADIVAAAEAAGIGATFAGAHPLTGSHRSGWGASHAALFDGARVFLCPTRVTTAETMRLAESFWHALRAGTETLDAARHDHEMAWRSHLPHLVSSALAVTLRDAGIRRSALGPGGRDMTRLSGGSLSMWAPIVEGNAAEIVTALRACEARLCHLREALEQRDDVAARQHLADARHWFDGEPNAGHAWPSRDG